MVIYNKSSIKNKSCDLYLVNLKVDLLLNDSFCYLESKYIILKFLN